MPLAIVKAYTAMLPRLRAEESLLVTERIGVGTGSFSGDTGQTVVRGWQRDADPERADATRARPVRTVASLRALGVKVHGAPA